MSWLPVRQCLAERLGPSGSVFGAIVDTMEAQKDALLAMTFENVPTIATPSRHASGKSNLDTLVETCKRSFKFDVVSWKLTPKDFGTPQSRFRAWMAACAQGRLVQGKMMDSMDRFACCLQMNDLASYFLPESDDKLMAVGRDAAAARAFSAGDYQLAFLHSGGHHIATPKAQKKEKSKVACRAQGLRVAVRAG